MSSRMRVPPSSGSRAYFGKCCLGMKTATFRQSPVSSGVKAGVSGTPKQRYSNLVFADSDVVSVLAAAGVLALIFR